MGIQVLYAMPALPAYIWAPWILVQAVISLQIVINALEQLAALSVHQDIKEACVILALLDISRRLAPSHATRAQMLFQTAVNAQVVQPAQDAIPESLAVHVIHANLDTVFKLA